MPQTISAGLAIVKILEAEGVRTVFGLPGGHILSVYDGLYNNPNIRHILVRHEQCAASMAAGYAQLTGEVGVIAVTAGPGATNLVSGIAEAFVGSLPLIVLAGRVGTNIVHKGAAQEVDTTAVFRPVTKWSVRIDSADNVVDILRQAFTVARSGKPGPVFVDMPRDFLPVQIPFESYVPVGKPYRPAGNPDALAKAADALLAAKNPIIIAGGGAVASDAQGALKTFAEHLAIPVLTSLSGRGILPDDHPLAGGGLGVHRNDLSKQLLNEADCVLALGTRMEEMETNWRPGFVPVRSATYIQVDLDPSEMGRSIVAHIPIVGDVRLVLEDLMTRALAARPKAEDLVGHPRVKNNAEVKARVEKEADDLASSSRTPMHPLTAIRAARAVFPRDTTVAIDVGVLAQQMAGAFPFFKVFEPRSLIVCSSYYGMGFAAAALPAARVAYPDRPALGFVGDGSFQMVMNILPVAVEHNLPVTWCVLNDFAYGSIRDAQEIGFDDRIIGTDLLVQPDFAKLAEACGCFGEKVEGPNGARPALERALEANRNGKPAVLDFLVSPERLRHTLEFFPFYSKRKPAVEPVP